jgi:hypothetical protein
MATSAKDFVMPEQTLFEQMRSLVKASGPSKNDQVHVLVTACIEVRIDTMGRIMDCALRLGFTRGHVARIVNDGVGVLWRKDADGSYHLISSGTV